MVVQNPARRKPSRRCSARGRPALQIRSRLTQPAHGARAAIGLCCALAGQRQGHLQPVTKALTRRIRRLLGSRRGRGREPTPPDPVTLPPVPIHSAADLETPAMRGVWSLLEAKKGARRFLSRADIDPGELVAILATVGLVEVHHQPLRFRMRLAGTGWRETLGFEATGLWLHDWPHPTQRFVLEMNFSYAVTERVACRARRHAVIDGAPLHYEAVVVPLSGDGETVDMLFCMSAPWQTAAPPSIDMPTA
jgi:hypothetical protein